MSTHIQTSRGGITESELHGAGSLSLNYTWRDHSVGITRGGITQSELYMAGSLSRNNSLKLPNHPGVGPRGGITQSELHLAGSLSLNYTWRDH